MNEETLFQEALSRPPEGRVAFLEAACAGRPDLLAAVRALLEAHDRTGNLLDESPPDLARFAPPADQGPSPATGDFLADPITSAGAARTTNILPPIAAQTVVAGRYALVEKIGEGGMGEVWVAKQSEPVKRKVALKLIKPGMDSRAVLQRFEQERQALALMEHPNIARVIDGGVTADHRPYFVMELVNGLALTAFCDGAKLGIRERLELFAAICQAVQHAHQKGIIHRDLKPTNILVTIIDGKPVPKVIDFGVAKATSGKITDESLSTQFGAIVGTLEYMSPEQAGFSGADIDTRADIYSLGVILYELLTGLRPIDAKRLTKAAFTEMIRMIKEEEPSKPSTRVSTDDSAPSMAALRHSEPKKLAALLRGELDWVVMKCLEKRRDRRYESASGLARDVRRYLDNEVVEARPPGAGYRIRKFVSRHKGQVAAAGLVMLALLTGIAGTTWGLIREAKANAELARANDDLTRSRAAVQQRYDLAVEAIKTFHTGVSEDFLLKEEKFKALRNRLLKSAADFYGKLGALLGKETDLASRRALAQSNFELAELTFKVGRKEDALAAHRAVLAARETLASEPGSNLETKADLGRSLTEVATSLKELGKDEEALATYHRAESLLAGLNGPKARSSLGHCRERMAILLRYQGRFDEALAALRMARSDQGELADAPGATTQARRELAETILTLGFMFWMSRSPEQAEPEFRAALPIYRQLAEEDPSDLEIRRGPSRVHFYLGNVLPLLGRTTEGEAEFRKSLAILEALARENSALTILRRGMGLCRNYLGNLLAWTGKRTEAEAEIRAAMGIFRKLVDENPTVPEYRNMLYACQQDLGLLFLREGRAVEAEVEFRQAFEIAQALSAQNPAFAFFNDDLINTRARLGDAARSLGRPAEARDDYDQAIALIERHSRGGQPDPWQRGIQPTVFRRRGLARRDLGDLAGAADDLRNASRMFDGLPQQAGPDLLERACCHATLAGLAGLPGSGIPAAEEKLAAERAMELLRRAVAMGYRNVDVFRTETALDPLRDRDDFKGLMVELEKAPPANLGKSP